MARQGLVARPPGIENRPPDHSSSARRHSGVSGSQPVLRLPASKTGYLEDIRCALQDLGLSDEQITLTLRGLPPYRSMWQPYKVWCRDSGRLVWTTQQVSDFSFDVAAQQLAEFLSYMATSGKVGSSGTLGNYRSAVNTAFMTVFNCQSLAESARVARAFRGFKSTNPSQPRWACLLYTSPSPRDRQKSRMPSSA